jgi:hypothetical protein
LQYSISGSATFYAGGGGGGSWAALGGIGGSGGGGAGGSLDNATCRANCSTNYSAQTGVSGTSNSGGGGGGSGNAGLGAPGGKGGSGIVIIRYTLNLTSTFNSLTLPGGITNAAFRTPISVTANVSVASKVSGAGDSSNTSAMFKVIAKNFIALPGIARDLNVAKQNIMKLVELEGGKASIDAPDAPMGSKVLSGGEAQAKLDKELEKSKSKTPTPAVPKKPGGGGLLGTITKMFKVPVINSIWLIKCFSLTCVYSNTKS